MHRTGHILLLHHSEGERMRYVADWFRAGLASEEKLFYVDVSGRGEDAVADNLVACGLPVEGALREKRLEIVPLEDLLQLDISGGLIDRSLTSEAYPAVRMAIRGDGVRDLVDPPQHQEVEQALGRLSHQRRLSVLCQYDGRTTQGDDLVRVLDLHPDWIYEADLSVHRRQNVLQIGGVLDSLDGEVLTRSLDRMTRNLPTDRVLALDLREVTGLTVGACRALLAGSKHFRDRGGRVSCGVPPGQPGQLLRTLLHNEDTSFQLFDTGPRSHPLF